MQRVNILSLQSVRKFPGWIKTDRPERVSKPQLCKTCINLSRVRRRKKTRVIPSCVRQRTFSPFRFGSNSEFLVPRYAAVARLRAKHKFVSPVPKTSRNERAWIVAPALVTRRACLGKGGKQRLPNRWSCGQETRRYPRYPRVSQRALQLALRGVTVTGWPFHWPFSRVTQTLIKHPILERRFNRAAPFPTFFFLTYQRYTGEKRGCTASLAVRAKNEKDLYDPKSKAKSKE